MSKIDQIRTCGMVWGMFAAMMTTSRRGVIEAGVMVEDGYSDSEIFKKFEPKLKIIDQLTEASGEINNIYSHGTERLN